MNRHRIGQRSITVEDQPFDAGRNRNHHTPSDLSIGRSELLSVLSHINCLIHCRPLLDISSLGT
jgi:hypothetical protein